MSDRYVIFQNETQPSLRQNILLDAEAAPLNPLTDTVKLQGRLSGSEPDVLLIDAAGVIEDGPTGLLRYDWAAPDTATPGNLIAWWLLDIGGNEQSTPAFVIPIIDQALVDPGVGIYASVLDVKALAGFLQDAWSPTSKPSEDDIAAFLAMTSGEIDAALLARGATLPLAPAGSVAVALRGLTADGGLVRALGATWPNDGPAGVAELRRDARSRYASGLTAILNGSHAAALALTADTVSGSASSFEIDEPEYGRWGWYPSLEDRNPAMAPGTHKGQPL